MPDRSPDTFVELVGLYEIEIVIGKTDTGLPGNSRILAQGAQARPPVLGLGQPVKAIHNLNSLRSGAAQKPGRSFCAAGVAGPVGRCR